MRQSDGEIKKKMSKSWEEYRKLNLFCLIEINFTIWASTIRPIPIQSYVLHRVIPTFYAHIKGHKSSMQISF
jgi:hypothetical protein